MEKELLHLRKSKKGIKIRELLFQSILFITDGTNSSLDSFDTLKSDESTMYIVPHLL